MPIARCAPRHTFAQQPRTRGEAFRLLLKNLCALRVLRIEILSGGSFGGRAQKRQGARRRIQREDRRARRAAHNDAGWPGRVAAGKAVRDVAASRRTQDDASRFWRRLPLLVIDRRRCPTSSWRRDGARSWRLNPSPRAVRPRPASFRRRNSSPRPRCSSERSCCRGD